MAEISYLGFRISNNGVQPGAEKTRTIKQFPQPSNVHQVRQFIGLTSYFRQFVPRIAEVAITILTRKSQQRMWNEEQMEACNSLKEFLSDKRLAQHEI